jgi:hypothetical protein
MTARLGAKRARQENDQQRWFAFHLIFGCEQKSEIVKNSNQNLAKYQ